MKNNRSSFRNIGSVLIIIFLIVSIIIDNNRNYEEVLIEEINFSAEFNDEMTIEFVYNGYYYVITSKIAYSDMLKLIESIR